MTRISGISSVSTDRRILAGVISGGILTASSIVAMLVQFRLAVDFLEPSLAGVWILFLTFSAYVAVMDLGFAPTLSREIGFVRGSNTNIEIRNRDIATLVNTTNRVFQVLAAISFLTGGTLGLLYFREIVPGGLSQGIALAWGIFLVGASANIFGAGAFAALYGLGDISTERYLRSAFQWAWVIFSYLALKAQYGIIGLSFVWAVHNILARSVAWLILYRRYPWIKAIKAGFSRSVFRRMVSPSLNWAVMGFGAILILQTGSVIIAWKMGPELVASYESMTRIIMTMMTLALYVVTSSTPFISSAYASGNTQELVRLILRNYTVAMTVICVFAAFLAIFADRVVGVWLGSEFFAGWPVTWTLLVMIVLETQHVCFAAAAMATGRVVFAVAGILAGLVNIGGALLLVDRMGLWGVAVAVLVAQVLTNNWFAPYVAFKHLPLPINFFAKRLVLIFPTLFIICLLVNAFLRYGLAAESLIGISTALASSSLAALLFVFFFILSSENRHLALSKLQILRNFGGGL